MTCWITLCLCASLLVSTCANNDAPPKNRDKRNNNYGLERRISNVPPLSLTLPTRGSIRPYSYYRKTKSELGPVYAVPALDPFSPYSQRDPLYDPSSTLPHNELPRSEDQATENNHLNEHLYGPPKTQYIERPVYIKEPEPIIEIIIKEANGTPAAPPLRDSFALPPKKKKEDVQVFYVKYKKNPHGTGKESVIYDKPVPALSPIQDEHTEEEVGEEENEYIVPTVVPPPATTIRAIIKPDSETYHANTGIHVTFGGEHHNPRAEKYSHDDDIVESAPQPAVQHPESQRFANHGFSEYTPERRAPQPYRPFNFNPPPTPPTFQHVPPVGFTANGRAPNFNGPPPLNYVPQRTNSNNNFKQVPLSIGKPYQFDRPNGQFQFARQPVHFNLPIQGQGDQSPPFNQKPTFGGSFTPPRDTFRFPPQQPGSSFHQNPPQSVFHQSGNSFSIQTNFGEANQGFNQAINQPVANFHTPTNTNYQTITPGRLLAEQQKQLLHQNQPTFNSGQAPPPLTPQFTQFAQNPFQNPGLQPHRQLQPHDHIQNQPQRNPTFVPPGGELIQSLPKYEQHLTFSSNGDATLTSGSNYTSSQQQQFPIEFSNTKSFDFQPPHGGQQGPSLYVTTPRPSTRYRPTSTTTAKPTTTTTTTTTTPKPTSTTVNLKDLNIELPDEVPDDLREQLLSSGILKNAQISVLDYDKVGDIPISALPPDQLANFYNAGGAQQIAAGSELQPTIVKPDGSAASKQAVEMKVVHYDPQTEEGQEVQQRYVKEGATQTQPVVLDDETYNRYLPLKVSGAAFPIPDELKGKHINSVVVLTPVDYNFYKQRITRAANNSSTDDEVHLIKNEALKQLLWNPTRENYDKFLEAESKAETHQQSVILLVTGSEPTTREIFMYDVATKSVSKLDGELSTAFVDAANTNDASPKEDGAPQASNVVETIVPVPPGMDVQQSIDTDIELQVDASNMYETKVRIIDTMRDDESSDQLKQFTDVSGDLMPAASSYSRTEYQMPS